MKKLLLPLIVLFISALEGFAQCTDSTPVWVVNENFTDLSGTTPPDCWTPVGNPNSFNFDAGRASFAYQGEMLVLPNTVNSTGVLTFKARNGTSRTYGGLTMDLGIYDGTTFTKVFAIDYGQPSFQSFTFDFSSNQLNGNIAFRGNNSSSISFLLDDVHYQSTCTSSSSATAVAKDITVKLDASGNVIVNASQVDNGSINSCEAPISNLSLDKTLFTCDDLGQNTVTLTADDGFGNTATATAVITVEPSLAVGFSTVYLSETGEFTLTPENGLSSGTTQCEGITYTFDKTDFTCEDVGGLVVTLMATYEGGTAAATRYMEIIDEYGPTALANDISVTIDENTGMAVITSDMVDNGSSDNCGITSMELSKTTFTCSDQGVNTVTLDVYDARGLTDQTTFTVTVNSYIPEVEVSAASTTVCFDGSNENAGTTITTDGSMIGVKYSLRNSADSSVIDGPFDGTGSALSFSTGAVSENTTFQVYAEVPSAGKALSLPASADYLAVGTPGSFNYAAGYTFSAWIKESLGGISNSYNTIFYAGGATGSDIEVYQNTQNGVFTVLHNRGNGGTLSTFGTSTNPLPSGEYAHLAVTYDGATVRLLVNGVEVGSGAMLPPVKSAGSELTFGYLNNSGFPGYQSFDGLMDDIRVYDTARTARSVSDDMGRCISGAEDNLVLYYDLESVSGTIYTDLVSSTPAQLKNGGAQTDDAAVSCAFDCYKIMSTQITVGDDVAPTVLVQHIEAQVGSSGLVAISADLIDNGSSDNCSETSALTYSLDRTSFSCADLGTNTVVLTVTDEAGNSASAEATVTVTSQIADETVTSSVSGLCPGDTEGASISIGSSVEGVEYYLKNSADNSIVDGPLAGSGTALSFATGALSQTTTFNVTGMNAGNAGSGLDFDGMGGYVNAGTDARGMITAMTIGIWVKTDYSGSTNYLAGKYDGYRGFLMYINANGKVVLDGRDASGGYKSTGASTTAVNDDVWHYVTGTIDLTTGSWKIYVDGALENSALNGAGSSLANSQYLTIGALNNEYFRGQMDEVAFWNSALDADTIAMQSDVCGLKNIETSAGFFDLNEGEGTVVNDLSPSAINGALTNMDAATDWISEVAGLECTTCELQMTTEVTITVEDITPPEVVVKDISVRLGEDNTASITAADIDNGSSDECSEITLTLDISTFDASHLGENTITLTALDGNNNSASASAIVTVNPYKQTQTITVTAVNDRVYGEADFALSASASSGLDVSYAVISGPVTVSAGTVSIIGVGDAVIEVTQAGNDDFLSASVEITFSISPAALIATADDQSVAFGSAIPNLTISYAGFVNGEDASVLSTVPGASTTATSASDVGTYPISLSTGSAANYTMTHVEGTLTVHKAQATVQITDLAHLVDGTAKEPTITTDPAGLNYVVTYDGAQSAPSAIGEYEVVVVIDEMNYEGNATATLVIGQVLGLENTAVRIFPNPTQKSFEVRSSEEQVVELYDLAGQLQMRTSTNLVTDVSQLSDGTYLIRVLGGDHKVYRLIKKN
ncbi:MAG: LamG-like jellyroll fold domain-containing protein [Marinoscillum sp.]|uniref:LamG-like jellyroll fold domain-containing protein n=1 Tax=Marinoscillum sp. TaxID=2024838 RepID=UPI0032F7C698